jgi:putative membrane protein
MMYGNGMFEWGGILGLILIVVVAYFLVKYFNEHKNNSNTFRKNDNAIDILKERYAKGEIDEEEYRSKLNKLNE